MPNAITMLKADHVKVKRLLKQLTATGDFDLAAEGMQLLVVDTQVKHSHSEGEYGKRREGCEKGAALLPVLLWATRRMRHAPLIVLACAIGAACSASELRGPARAERGSAPGRGL